MASRRSGCGIPGLFLLILLVVGGWSGYWFYLSSQIRQGLAQTETRLEAAGWRIEHGEPRIDGWPFRIQVVMDDVEVIAPSGHGLRAPELRTEATAYQLDRWVIVASDGLELGRAAKGWVAVEGQALRASLSQLRGTPPRVIVEFDQPRFTPTEGSEPFPITQAERLIINLMPEAEGRAGVLFDLDAATPRPGGVLARMSENRVFDLSAEGVADQAARLSGATWSEALAAWSREGGALTEVRLEATAEQDFARGQTDRLSADANGRLVGDLQVHLRGGTAPIAGLAQAPGVDPRAAAAVAVGAQLTSGFRGETNVLLRFSDGRTVVGPVSLGPAPKVF
jgi:hypothetical protein